MNVFDLMAKLTLDRSDYEKGLGDAEGSASKFGAKWEDGTAKIKSGLKGIGEGVGIFTAVGAAAFASADKMSQSLDQIDKMSQKLGMSTDAYQKWDHILQLSGADINSMGAGLKTLTNKFDDAKNGSAGAIESFQRLGLSMEQIQGMSREELFETVITQFQSMGDTAERAALANDLLGRSGAELSPLFNQTAEDTAALAEQFEAMGGIIGEDAVKDGAAFQDSLTNLQGAMKGASAQLFDKLIPAITELMNKFAEFVADGGLDTIIELLKTLIPIIGAVVAGFAAFKIITGVITLIQGLIEVFQVLSAVFAANPIGLVVLALAALAAALVTAYKHSEAFRDKVNAAFAHVRDFVQGVAQKIEDAVAFIKDLPDKALKWGRDMIDNFKKGIMDKKDQLMDGVKGIAQSIKDFLGFSEPKMGPLSNFHTYAPDMIDLFVDGMNKGIPKLENAADSLAGAVSDGIEISGVAPMPAQTSGNDTAALVQMFNALAASMRQTEHTTIIELDGMTIAKAVDKPLQDIDRQRGLSLAGGEAW